MDTGTRRSGCYVLRNVVIAVRTASAAPKYVDRLPCKAGTKDFNPYHAKNAIVK